ncbi:TRAP transporter small permease [Magnetospirillum moscoviense]|uniref:TRAP transporter small permease protein n=1 Tax=Magnetospirillum moscoviense TaxID=1437059 RepID=A0A178MXX0_9PROT|nr:TRAP transporter small permease [Magnetospirillum moscoviense]MBF0325912.1 TRAP transporter small permease [Alphaproteobacteria bacterium]OAN58000.1 hypothetical protein A6A05_07450 [Magnetospirillum moscoviense]
MADAIYTETDTQYGPIGRVLDALSKAFAIAAGIVLTVLAILSLVSIIGRSAFAMPVMGDYELVQIMSAVAVAMSLPFCQMVRGHVIVDFFTHNCPPKINRFMDLIANLLLCLGAFLFAWRNAVGLMELRKSGDASMLLDIPTWVGYVPFILSFALLGCTALYSAWEDFTGERK